MCVTPTLFSHAAVKEPVFDAGNNITILSGAAFPHYCQCCRLLLYSRFQEAKLTVR